MPAANRKRPSPGPNRTSTPLVSVITPCLNPGELLKNCLRSVEAQTYPNVEHIVVDGGSTDGTLELLQGSRATRWISEPDAGQTAAINKGFRMAAGEVLSWLNADDELKPDSIETALGALLREGAGWVYGDLEVVEGDRVWLLTPPSDPSMDMFGLGKGGVVPQPGSLISRQALHQVGELDEDLHLAMDFDLWVRLIDAAIPSTYVSKTLATFRIHPASKSGSTASEHFFGEEAKALFKSGRAEIAQLALGRAAAHRAAADHTVSSKRLREQIDMVCADNPIFDSAAKKRVKAAALTEAALFQTLSSPKGLLHLLALAPWQVKETRTRLFAAVGKTLGAPGTFLERWRH